MDRDDIVRAVVKVPTGWLENRYGDAVSFLVNTEKGRFVYGRDLAGIFYIQTPDGEREGFPTLAAAQAAAEADYRARIGAALDLEKVEKLVEAAEPFAYEIDAPAMADDRPISMHIVIGQHRALVAALAAFRGQP